MPFGCTLHGAAIRVVGLADQQAGNQRDLLISDPPREDRATRMSANLCICFSEGKRRISLDGAPQPLLVNWLRHNIDRAAEYLLKALSERIQPPEIGKAALRLFLAQSDDNIYIRTVGCIAASDRSEDRQSRYPRSL